MSRFTRTVSASGASGGDSHSTHCIYEWELLANCVEWDCCYSGCLDIKVDSSKFNAFKLEMNGIVLNCSGGTSNWVLPNYKITDSTFCKYWCCNSYNWVRPWEINGCQGMRMCFCYCTGGCHPEVFSCCTNCIPKKFVGCVMSGSADNTQSGIHGAMCASKGNNQNVNQMFTCNVWSAATGATGKCWEGIDSIMMYSGLGGVCPRWNNGGTCGYGGQIPNWRFYGIRCGVQQEPSLGLRA